MWSRLAHSSYSFSPRPPLPPSTPPTSAPHLRPVPSRPASALHDWAGQSIIKELPAPGGTWRWPHRRGGWRLRKPPPRQQGSRGGREGGCRRPPLQSPTSAAFLPAPSAVQRGSLSLCHVPKVQALSTALHRFATRPSMVHPLTVMSAWTCKPCVGRGTG